MQMHKNSLNQVVLIGRLGQNPEQRSTTSGMTIANMSIATTTSKKVEFAANEWTEETEWHRCTAFGKIAEHACRYGAKGRLVYLIGKLQTRKWTDNNGTDHYTTSVLIDQFQFLDKNENAQSKSPYVQQETIPDSTDTPPVPEEEDDLPF
jgi:single-strand DNA-binding protein